MLKQGDFGDCTADLVCMLVGEGGKGLAEGMYYCMKQSGIKINDRFVTSKIPT